MKLYSEIWSKPQFSAKKKLRLEKNTSKLIGLPVLSEFVHPDRVDLCETSSVDGDSCHPLYYEFQ